MNFRTLLHNLPSSPQDALRRICRDGAFTLAQAVNTIARDALAMQLSQQETDNLPPLIRVLRDDLQARHIEEATHVLHTSQVLKEREVALALLMHADYSAFDTLTDPDRVLLSGPWVRPMLRHLSAPDRSPQQALFSLLGCVSLRYRPMMIAQMNDCALEVGVSLPTGIPTLPNPPMGVSHVSLWLMEHPDD